MFSCCTAFCLVLGDVVTLLWTLPFTYICCTAHFEKPRENTEWKLWSKCCYNFYHKGRKQHAAVARLLVLSPTCWFAYLKKKRGGTFTLIFLTCKVSACSWFNLYCYFGGKQGNLEECKNWLPLVYNYENLLPHIFIQERPFAALWLQVQAAFYSLHWRGLSKCVPYFCPSEDRYNSLFLIPKESIGCSWNLKEWISRAIPEPMELNKVEQPKSSQFHFYSFREITY